MWSYFGAKTNTIDHYPPPVYDKIIEPFAGTARYSLRFFDRDVTIVDKYETVIKIWKWLQQCSPQDVLRLPRFMKPGEGLNDFTFECEEARNLMGFIISKGVNYPRITASRWIVEDRPYHINSTVQRISQELWKIRDWKIVHGSYDGLNNEEATWFVDPPYQHGGEAYVESSKNIDFPSLGEWCKSRKGQVIVCENMKADWLDFKPMMKHRGRTGIMHEAIWSNLPTAFDNEQLTLL